jgi:hypothetical protein
MGALDAETRSSIPDVCAAKSDDARLQMLYPQRRQSLCGIVSIGIRRDWRRDSNLRIWESDPLHSLSHKRGFDAVRWSPAKKVSPATSTEMRKFECCKEVHAGCITLARD